MLVKKVQNCMCTYLKRNHTNIIHRFLNLWRQSESDDEYVQNYQNFNWARRRQELDQCCLKKKPLILFHKMKRIRFCD